MEREKKANELTRERLPFFRFELACQDLSRDYED